MVAIFTLSFTVMMLLAGLALDATHALSQRRSAQNAADFAAMAGTRVVARKMSGDAAGTNVSVRAAIDSALAANGAPAPLYSATTGPRWVGADGALLSHVGADTTIPAAASGVAVSATLSWTPFVLGIVGVSNWSATATATARVTIGNAAGVPAFVFPGAIWKPVLDTFTLCPPTKTAQECGPDSVTGNLDGDADKDSNPGGGDGWLAFGCTGQAGQDGHCGNDLPYLQAMLDAPGDSHGCCTGVPPGGYIDVRSLTGNKTSGDGRYWVDNKITVLLAVYQTFTGNGSNGIYRIIGFAGFELTQVSGAKNIYGVLRTPMTTTTAEGVPTYVVQLVR
jgi:hypothetical protein